MAIALREVLQLPEEPAAGSPVSLPRWDDEPAAPQAPLLDLFRRMTLVRLFEESTYRASREGRIGGYLHLYVGQEAVAAGFLAQHRRGDKVITAYRDHAHALLLGCDPGRVMAELYGRETGVSKGKGGSMHLFDVEHDLMGGYGIVGGHIPLGVGMAYALRYGGSNGIVQLYLGDGAINNGAFHEAANLAALWGQRGLSPTLFIVENNRYGMGTSVERATAMTNLAAKFDAYGIAHEQVDGMDVEAVLACAERATERVRQSGRPFAVEAITYRIVPHGAGDLLQRYREQEEVARWRERDPLKLLEQRLLAAGAADAAQIEQINAEMAAVVEQAVRFADASPEPPLEDLYADVYGAPVAAPAA